MVLTKKGAATAYARAWNRLDCSEFLQLLAEDCCYESQWVYSALEGKQAIADYFTGKLKAVKESEVKVRAELAVTTTGPDPEEDCVLLTQRQDNEEVTVVVLFKVKADKIQRYDMCVPELYRPKKQQQVLS